MNTANCLARRQFILFSTAAAASMSLGLEEAGAQTLTNMFLGIANGHPLLAIAGLVEAVVMGRISASEQSAKLARISNQITDIAAQQGEILKELADMRIVMREEVRRGFLDNDMRELTACSETFRMYVVSEDSGRASNLLTVAQRVDFLAMKIATYGTAAAPAYLAAIALQNAAHLQIGTSKADFRDFNGRHKANLLNMIQSVRIYNSAVPQVTGGSDADRRVLAATGKRYPLAELMRIFRPDVNDILHNMLTVQIVGYQYKGFDEQGKVILQPYFGDVKSTAVSADQPPPDRFNRERLGAYVFPFINSKYAGDYQQIPALSGDPDVWYDTTYDRQSDPLVEYTQYEPDASKDGDINEHAKHAIISGTPFRKIKEQANAIARYYQEMYEHAGPVEFATRNAQSLKAYLHDGIQDLDRIISANYVTTYDPGTSFPAR